MSRTSVVLSTYNGERYILELLDSLRMQSRKPDEVLILDDGSTDDTVAIIRKYIDEYQLNSWDLRPCRMNVGWRANFRRGILACKGDLIFTCDQDDIWSPEKIELMAKEMDSHPEINLLACEVQPFYEGKNETYRVDKPDSHNGVLEPVGLEGSDFLYTMRPGCAHCIRREFVQVIAPWWKETYAHDEFLWRYSALTRSLVRYNKVLVKFRRHGDNASARGIVTRESRLDVMEYDIDFFEQARDYLVYQGAMTDELDRLLDGLNAWFVARRNVLSGKVTLKDLHEMLCIGKRWYSSWKGPLVDLFFAIRPTGSLHA